MRLLGCAAYLFLFCVLRAFGQVNTGELRLKVTDPAGLGVKTTAQLVSDGNQYSNTFTTNEAGVAQLTRLPYGVYLVRVTAKGFAPAEKTIDVRSAIPIEATVKLEVAPVTTVVNVNEADTLIDPDQPILNHADRLKADRDPRRLAARPLGAGPRQHPARMAL